MSLKNVVVEDCQFEISVNGAIIGSGNVNITSLASTNTKVVSGEQKKGVYAGVMNISVSNYADTNISMGAGMGVINPSAQKTSVDGNAVILEGDSGDVTLTGVHPISGEPVINYSVTVKISSAGQTVVKAE